MNETVVLLLVWNASQSRWKMDNNTLWNHTKRFWRPVGTFYNGSGQQLHFSKANAANGLSFTISTEMKMIIDIQIPFIKLYQSFILFLPLKLSSKIYHSLRRQTLHIPRFCHHGDSSKRLQCIPLLPAGSTCPARATVYLALIYSSQLTLQLGLGDFPTRLSGCDSVSAGRIHERSLEDSCPVFHARCQITLTPGLEFILAFPYSAQKKRKRLIFRLVI